MVLWINCNIFKTESSAFARSLYRYLTGVKIVLDLPYETDTESEPRKSIEESATINISPNPSSGVFKFDYKNLHLAKCIIYNLSGVEIYKMNLHQKEDSILIDLGSQPNGMYIMQIEDSVNGAVLNYKKLVVAK